MPIPDRPLLIALAAGTLILGAAPFVRLGPLDLPARAQGQERRSPATPLLPPPAGGRTASPAPPTTAPPAGSAPSTGAGAPLAQGGPASGMVTIESDRQLADNVTGIVTATGNVRISYPDRGMVATSRQAQYYSREGRLVLSGDVEVIDGDGQRIQAERLVYRLDSERLVAEPTAGKQVMSRLRLQPLSGARRAAGTPRPPMP